MPKEAIQKKSTEKDSEGEYRPEFVKRILAIAKNKQEKISFLGYEDFLKKIS